MAVFIGSGTSDSAPGEVRVLRDTNKTGSISTEGLVEVIPVRDPLVRIVGDPYGPAQVLNPPSQIKTGATISQAKPPGEAVTVPVSPPDALAVESPGPSPWMIAAGAAVVGVIAISILRK